jgi:prepilin-type N-terminal cleavage/methylation domain-containing protein
MKPVTKNYPPNNGQQSGFTLVELLVVVALIAILAAVSTTTLQNYSEKAKETNARRTAQTVANVAAAAQAAGNVSLASSLDIGSVVTQLESGVNGTGIFSEKIFQTTKVSADTLERAKTYLTIDQGLVHYSQTPQVP